MVRKEADTVRDRRANRFELPPCRKCGGPSVTVHGRTVDALILQCLTCDERWIVPKPPYTVGASPSQP
jgi:hypothetical protein